MRTIRDLSDVQVILRELLDWKDRELSKSKDLRLLQIKNLGAATDDSDAVTLAQVREEIRKALGK